MSWSTLAEWLQWLESCHPTEIDLGLERIAGVADRLAVDLSGSRVVTVAGTNGKGSCVAALQALCLDAGLSVGTYTSPHLLYYNERVCVQGRPVTDEQLIAAFARVYAALQGESLTYFEFGTLAALDIFQRQSLDIVILEVGLGGRLDAVNVVDPDISVVTSVALDHQTWLGSDRESIGFEKAGIFRRGVPAICADPQPPLSLLQHAADLGAVLSVRGRDFDLVVDKESGNTLWWSGDACARRRVPGVERCVLPIQSLAAALQVAALLGIAPQHWSCLASCTLSGRYQRIAYRGRSLLLDVAHNPQAASLLAERLRGQPCSGRRLALFAVMADKDIAAIVRALDDCFDEWWLAALPETPRAAAVEALSAIAADTLEQRPVRCCASVPEALALALEKMSADDELVVFGSFYTVAAVLEQQQCQGGVSVATASLGGC